ncbi:MAG: TonB-dependent receptor [Cryobacterium sp.]|nr:TonB-dependent receptor [Oligoflexia bacterium]
MIRKISLPLLLISPLLLTSKLTWAETMEEPTEKIEVTGSHIKRIDTEGVSPVTTITRKELEKTGYNSIGDVLRDSNVNSFGSMREASGSNAAGNAEVNLRGLGSSNTLVLLNGQRLPSDAVTGAVDLNMIPMAAVERVEILKDGASAIYGSDALGGVVNIITRRDFTGNEVNVSQMVPQMKGGAKGEASIVNGVNGEKFNIVNVLQVRNNARVYSKDRDWTSHNISNTGSPGSYRNGSTPWKADPNCPPSKLVTTPSGTFCTFNTSDFSTELPELKQIGALSEANYELNSTTKLHARLSGTYRVVKWSYAPAPGTFTIPGANTGNLNPSGGPLPGTTPGADLDVRYRLTDLGTRDSEVNTYGYNALVGSTHQLSSTWELDLSAAHNIVDTSDKGVNGYALQSILDADIAGGRFNPFGLPGSKGSLDNARYVPEEHTRSQLSAVEVKASGEIGKIGERPIGLAVGTSAVYQKYKDSFDSESVSGNVFGNAGSSGGGQRNSQAFYTEFSIPVTEKLELQAAGRYDHYSDFGSTFNPKGAFLLHATKDLLFRGSVGTGFKAPLMQELYAATSDGNPTFIDAVACKSEQAAGGATPSCLPAQYSVTSSGNSGLKQQTSLSYNLGTVYQINPALSFGTDFFITKTKNVVGIDYADLTKAERDGVNVGQYGIIVNRTAGYIDSIVAPLQNLASQEVSGLDFSVGYQIGNLRLSTDHSQMLYFREEGFPGSGMKDRLGENGRPSWRNATTANYVLNPRNSVALTALTISGHEKAVKEQGNLSHYTALDLQYVYATKSSGAFTLGIRNLLNTTPPLDDSNPTKPLDVTLYDQLGRQFMAAYKVKF